MAACGPFEPHPHIAVGLSGGADSVALMLGLIDWVRERGGRVTALTVDHGLRAGSAGEALAAGEIARRSGAAHEILRWPGAKPGSGIQAAARVARYGLLSDWCRSAGVLHLALAHHADDQRETVAMRAARAGAGAAGPGAAGMSLISARDGVRLLRPLLPVPGALLREYLQARGVTWIEDPSNAALQFERVRWRRGLQGELPGDAEIARAGKRRAGAEAGVAELLMHAATIHPSGFVLADIDRLRDATPALAGHALGALIALVSGNEYRPAPARLEKLGLAVFAGPGMHSLGGALIGRWRQRLLVCREAAGVAGVSSVAGTRPFVWDNRFRVLPAPPCIGMTISALGEAGLAEIGLSGLFRLKDNDIPAPARASLPALRDPSGTLVEVPFLGFRRNGAARLAAFAFQPHNSATGCGFTVA